MHLPAVRRLAVLLACLLAPLEALPQAPETSILALMHQAAEQRKEGDYASAAVTYRQVLRRAPGLFEARLFLADTLRKLRRNSEAEQEYQAARGIRPADPLPYAGLSDLRREGFRFSEALAVLDDGERVVPVAKREPILFARGTTLRQSGDVATAVEVLSRGVKNFPASPRLREALARSREAQGRLEEALAAWEAARKLAPEDPRIRIASMEARDLALRQERAREEARVSGDGSRAEEDLARSHFLARQFPEAAEWALAAGRREAARSDLQLLRALALERAGRFREAEAELKRISGEAPEHLLAQYHRAYLVRLRGDGPAEERIWRDTVEKHPQDATARLMLVLLWKRKGSLDSAVETLRRGTTKGNRPPSLRILEGMALEESGREEEAARVYAEIFRAAPEDPESGARLSELLSRRPALLREWLERETVPPGRARVATGPAEFLLRAQLLLTAGREEEAARGLREAASRFPDRPEVPLAQASISDRSGRGSTETSSALLRALELAPDSPWVRLRQGLWLLQSGDPQGAVREAEKVVTLSPDLPEGQQLLGAALRAAGDYARAAKAFERALLLDPADSSGVNRFQLSLVLAAQGRRLEARSALEGDLPPFPELIYRLAWSFVGRTFLDRSYGGQDWRVWRDRFADPSASANAAYAAVAEMLSSLREPYTRLRGPEETAAIYLQARSEKLETDRAGAPTRSSRSVLTDDLGENLGYIRLTNFSDPSAREAIRRALDEMARRDGLVLDLRGNTGGLAAEADAIAGLLLEPGEEIGRERTRFGEETQKAPQTRPVLSRKRVVVLTDRRTGSAAEKLAAGLQGAGRATIVGEGTFGKGAGQVGCLLPGGPMVLVTALENLTREGRSIQGRGVLPDAPGDDMSLEKAKELLRQPAP